jgi:precorrin-2 dehydrogenase/sirohydrochlorin ferrochelatase
MFPLFLNMAGRLAVVVGGGPVGRRKANALLEGGAKVRLVCLEPRPADERAALEWLTASYRAHHLDGASVVIAAASADVNRGVVADARAKGIWVNSATDPQEGDFYLPAVVRRGDLVIAVGTRGAVPTLASAVRTLLEAQLDEGFARWVQCLAELRPVVRALIADPERRREAMRRLCESRWLDRLRGEDADQVRAAMLAEVQLLVGGAPGGL